MSNRKDVPVYLFTGFLESGKTKFIQETLEDRRFCNGERTLLLVCEEGEEEYAPDQFADKNVFIRVINSQEELNAEALKRFLDETKSARVVVEYNGMWLLDALYGAMPEGWMVYQEFMFADAGTFITYNANMRQLVVDKLAGAEMLVLNRMTPGADVTPYHKIARAVNRRIEILYEYTDGSTHYDDIEDPLPFDLNAPVVEIGDDDFGIWYMDCQDEPQKYAGKTVKFLAQVCQTNRAGKNSFVPGRFAMTCCVQDIQFVGFPCSYDGYKALEQRAWVKVTAKVGYKFHNIYRGKGPVLTALSVEPAEKPLNDVVTFS